MERAMRFISNSEIDREKFLQASRVSLENTFLLKSL